MFTMQDVMHCNKCSVKFNNIIQFFLTECGHILCEKCNEKLGTSGKCVVCNKATSAIKCGKDMDPEILKFFSPIEPLLQTAVEVSNFQRNHGKSYIHFLLRKYNDAKKRCITYHVENQKLKQENNYFRSVMNPNGEQHSFPFVTSTPALNRDISSANINTSMLSSLPFTPVNTSKYPGYAKKLVGSNIQGGHQMKGVGVASSVCSGPSPAQTVPNFGRHYPAPVHMGGNQGFRHGIPKK